MPNEEKELTGKEKRLANLKPFQKGVSGNPGGRGKALITRALREELEAPAEDSPTLTNAQVIARKLVSMAKSGEIQAIKEIADRAEGKPRQSVTLTMDTRERLEAAVNQVMADTECARDEAVAAVTLFEPMASELLN
jgi:HPt (histidine-containing phosphotransfer) domain-containing protein